MYDIRISGMILSIIQYPCVLVQVHDCPNILYAAGITVGEKTGDRDKTDQKTGLQLIGS